MRLYYRPARASSRRWSSPRPPRSGAPLLVGGILDRRRGTLRDPDPVARCRCSSRSGFNRVGAGARRVPARGHAHRRRSSTSSFQTMVGAGFADGSDRPLVRLALAPRQTWRYRRVRARPGSCAPPSSRPGSASSPCRPGGSRPRSVASRGSCSDVMRVEDAVTEQRRHLDQPRRPRRRLRGDGRRPRSWCCSRWRRRWRQTGEIDLPTPYTIDATSASPATPAGDGHRSLALARSHREGVP